MQELIIQWNYCRLFIIIDRTIRITLTLIHTHYAFYTTVQAKQPRDYVTIIKLVIDYNKYPRNKLLCMTINPFPVLIKTRKYRINNNFLSKFICHEPYIEITCNYFLQVAQTPEVSLHHLRYLAIVYKHSQLCTQIILYEGTEWLKDTK